MTPAWKKKLPFLRWSFWRLAFGMKHLLREWQVGDGREERLAKYVVTHARRGDPSDAVRVIDEYGYNKSMLINVGDEKGRILDDALRQTQAKRVLELGTYCGYSAVRMAAAAPEARITSIEFSDANAGIARRILDHAGLSKRVRVVVGTLGDGGATLRKLREEHAFTEGCLDFVFIDHDKNAYLPDLKRILEQRWLRRRAVVVADNVKVPGAPEYRAYMVENEGKTWKTAEHDAHVEYQTLIKDLVLVSELL